MFFKNWLLSEETYDIPRTKKLTPGYKLFYHGTTLQKYKKIIKEGKIKAWGQEGIDKSSSGNMYEQGLIWLFSWWDKELADSYARGVEYSRKDAKAAHGGIIEVELPGNLKWVDRYEKISAEQAEMLKQYYPEHQQSYKPIKEGLGLEYAVWRLWEYSPNEKINKQLFFGDVLKLLNLDGIIYEDVQYGLARDSVDILSAWRI